MAKRGIIIANTGTPDAPTPAAVRRYLAEFLSDPRICPMNPIAWKLILNAFILPRRSKASASKYQGIWTDEGSPLHASMASLAAKLERSLDGVPVKVGMSYGAPSMIGALRELRESGCDSVTVLPLYPQGAYSTTKAVIDKLAAALEELAWEPHIDLIEGYSDDRLYLSAISDSILKEGFQDGDLLLITFHSIPMKDVKAGDDYPNLAEATAKAIAKRLGLDDADWRMGFQSRFDSRAWVGPFTSEAVAGLQKRDGRLFVVAPNFSVDCLETLYEIDDVMRRDYCETSGKGNDEFVFVRCLNDSDAHVELLKSLVKSHQQPL